MPAIVAFFSTLFTGMFNSVFLLLFQGVRWAALNLGRKFFVVALWVAGVSLAVSVFIEFMSGLFVEVFSTIPEIPYLPYFLPGNLVLCLQVIASAHAVSATYALSARIAARKAAIFAA